MNQPGFHPGTCIFIDAGSKNTTVLYRNTDVYHRAIFGFDYSGKNLGLRDMPGGYFLGIE